MAATHLANIARVTCPTLSNPATIKLGPPPQAVPGISTTFISFDAAGVVNGSIVRYGIEDLASGHREIGYATYDSHASTLLRTPTQSTMPGNALIPLSGLAQVFITAGAEDFSISGTIYLGDNVVITTPAAATTQFGAADSSTPVAQTIRGQSAITSANVAGTNFTMQAPAGTGSGLGGSWIFQVAPHGSSGSTQNTWVTALTIDETKKSTFAGNVSVLLNTAPAPTSAGGSVVQITAADSAVARFEADSFGTISVFTVRRANGTGASPTALVSADQIGAFNFHGYYVTGGPGYSGAQASMQGFATQNWTSTALGTKIVLATTPNNSTTLTTGFTLDQDQTGIFAGAVHVAGHAVVGGGADLPLSVTAADSSTIAIISGTTKAWRFGADGTETLMEAVDNSGVGSFQPGVIGGSTLTFRIAATAKLSINASGNVTAVGTVAIGGGTAIASSGPGGTMTSAAYTAIGTSGATLPLLNGANTWSGVQTITNSDIALLGSSTGATTFTSANAGASNFTLTFPARTDTLVTLAGSETLTNKTLTTPTITGGTLTGLTGLAIRDTSAAFDVTIAATSSGALSAGRILTLNMGNVAHTLAFGTTANTITFPNVSSDTVAMLGATQTLSAVNTFSNTTDASSAAAAAVILSGGLAVAKSANIGTSLLVGDSAGASNAFIQLGTSRASDGAAVIDLFATSGAGTNFRIFRVAGANGLVRLVNNGTGDFIIEQFDAAGSISFQTNAAEKMRLSAAGGLAVTSTASTDAGAGNILAQNGLSAKTLALTRTGLSGGSPTIQINASQDEAYTPGATTFYNAYTIQSVKTGGNGYRNAINVNQVVTAGTVGDQLCGAQINGYLQKTGASFAGSIFALNSYVKVDSGLDAASEAVSFEADTDVRGNVTRKVGIQIADISTSSGAGSSFDAGMIIGKQTGGTARGYNYGIQFGFAKGSELNTALLFVPSGALPNPTTLNGVDFSNLQGAGYTGLPWKSNLASIDGVGNIICAALTIGAGSQITSSGPGGALASGAFATAGITALTGQVTATGPGSAASVITTAQPDVHTWALTQTFTVAPVFTNQSTSRTALGLGTAATQNTGTSGATLPFLNGLNTWGATQAYTPVSDTSIITSTGGGNTGSGQVSALDLSWTVNTSGNPDVIAFRITNTAHGASTKLLNIYAGASGTTSALSLDSAGSLAVLGNVVSGASVSAAATLQFNWTGRGILSSPGAGAVQFGAADAAAAVAQTVSVQNVVAGTSNTAGANTTINGSVGTGTGVGGDIIFNSAPAGTTGTAQNTLKAALTLKGTGSIVLGNAAIATNATDGFIYIPTCAGTPTGVPTAATGRVALVYDTTNHQFWIYDSGWKQPKTPAAAATVTWQ